MTPTVLGRSGMCQGGVCGAMTLTSSHRGSYTLVHSLFNPLRWSISSWSKCMNWCGEKKSSVDNTFAFDQRRHDGATEASGVCWYLRSRCFKPKALDKCRRINTTLLRNDYTGNVIWHEVLYCSKYPVPAFYICHRIKKKRIDSFSPFSPISSVFVPLFIHWHWSSLIPALGLKPCL